MNLPKNDEHYVYVEATVTVVMKLKRVDINDLNYDDLTDYVGNVLDDYLYNTEYKVDYDSLIDEVNEAIDEKR